MRDAERYANPDILNPYRFVHLHADPYAVKAKYTDVNCDCTFWSSPRKSWHENFPVPSP